MSPRPWLAMFYQLSMAECYLQWSIGFDPSRFLCRVLGELNLPVVLYRSSK